MTYRLVWHGEAARKKWEPFLSKYYAAYEEASLRTVEDGAREAAIVSFSQVEYMAFLPWAMERKLRVRVIRTTADQAGFTHFYEPGAERLVVGVARRERALDAVERGPSLGYPPCCVASYDPARNVDPMVAWARSGGRVDARCNPLLRYAGVRVAPHIPCSPRCRRSAALGQKFLRYIPADLAAAARDLLDDVSWDSWRGTAVVVARPFRIVLNTPPLAERSVVAVQGGILAREAC